MKKLHTLGIIAVLFLASCDEDYLQRDPGVDQTKEDVFSDPILASRFADRSYFFTINDYGRLGESGQPFRGTTAEFTDEAVSGSMEQAIFVMNKGNWSSNNATDVTTFIISSRGTPPYVKMYQGIRNVNVMLEQIDNVPWVKEPRLNKDLIKAQQLFMRAFCYFELVKRWGGVVIVDKALYLDEDGKSSELKVPRSSFEETVAFIENDLDEAELLFDGVREFVTPDQITIYTNTAGWNPFYASSGEITDNNGRADLGAVRALRSELLLLAASPLHNPGNDASKWQKAADAARQVIDMGRYSLHPVYRDLLEVPSSPEYIMASIKGPRSSANSTFYGQYVMSPGSGGARGVLNPTQNHVDLYEMADGRRIHDAGSGYSAGNPYENRDPRLVHNILYNGHPWQGREIETWYMPGTSVTYGEDAGGNNTLYTSTGYYSRKMWPEELEAGSSAGALHNYVFFRYGKILLNYAEALNEAQGPVQGVIDAIDLIRTSRSDVQMPDVAATLANRGLALNQENMRDLIHNERAVELAFEDHRWWDILRWKKGEEIVAQPIYGMKIEKTGADTYAYTPFLMSDGYQRVFEEHMHLYPVPKLEMIKSDGSLQQNPGWPDF